MDGLIILQGAVGYACSSLNVWIKMAVFGHDQKVYSTLEKETALIYMRLLCERVLVTIFCRGKVIVSQL